MNKIAVILVTVMTSFAVKAEVPKRDVCQYFAKVAESTATARDGGINQDELQEIIYEESPDEMSEAVALAAIERVFAYPRVTPREEGNTAYEFCIENWEE